MEGGSHPETLYDICLHFRRCCRWYGTGRTNVDDRLTDYAVKHAVYHLTDAGKQAENIARFLCSLHYVQRKLKLKPEIPSNIAVGYLLDDYEHSHYQVSGYW